MSLYNDLTIDFGIISNENISDGITEKIDTSLFVAKKFLEKIPSVILPKEKNRRYFEITSEGFLYFIIGARDALLQKINYAQFFNPIPDSKVTLESIKRKLNENKGNDRLAKVLQLLENCTQEPIKLSPKIGDTDRSKSWLLELNNMRNQISHKGILYIAIENEWDTPAKLLVSDDVRPDNPYEYFSDCYKKFIELDNNITELLQKG